MAGLGGVGGVGGLGGAAGLWGDLLGKVADKLPPGVAQQCGFDPNSSFQQGGMCNPEQSMNMMFKMLEAMGIPKEMIEALKKMIMDGGQAAPAASAGKGAGAAQGGGGG